MTQTPRQVRMFAPEAEHRARNLLALVLATVHLTKAETADDFKAAIEGRLKALSNAHTLLFQSRCGGAHLRTLVTEELSPYELEGPSRADVERPDLILRPRSAQAVAMVLHEL